MPSRLDNERIRAVVRCNPRERLPFFCECGRPACAERVWLSVEELGELIARGDRVLAHRPKEQEMTRSFACGVAGCDAAATHEVLEVVVDDASGRATFRRDARLPYLCSAHAELGGSAPGHGPAASGARIAALAGP
jgi:hypothetical protein